MREHADDDRGGNARGQRPERGEQPQ